MPIRRLCIPRLLSVAKRCLVQRSPRFVWSKLAASGRRGQLLQLHPSRSRPVKTGSSRSHCASNPSFERTAFGSRSIPTLGKCSFASLVPRLVSFSIAVQRQDAVRQVLRRPPVLWRSAHRHRFATGAAHGSLRTRPLARGQNRLWLVASLLRTARPGCPSSGGQHTSGASSTATTSASSLLWRFVPRRPPSRGAGAHRQLGALAHQPAVYGLPNPSLERTCPGLPGPAAQLKR